MQNSFRLKYRCSAFRAAVLFGVLAGLLFSCGEGIRLFPFPPATAAARGLNSEWKNGGENDYQKNVHRFENTCVNCHSKIQRGEHHKPLADVYHAPNRRNLLDAAVCCKIDFSFNPRFFKSRLIAVAGGSRAPPVV
jgi:hypothetical protein